MNERVVRQWYADTMKRKHDESLAFCVYDSKISNTQLIHNRAFLIGVASAFQAMGLFTHQEWDDEFNAIYDIFDKKNLLKEKERMQYLKHGD